MTNEQIKTFERIIEMFSNQGILNHVVFIGSWAIYAYQFYFQDDKYIPEFKTRDIDILYPNIRKPNHKIDIKTELFNMGFYQQTDRLKGTTKFFKDTDFELEFLVQEKGSGECESYQIASLGLKAEGFRNMGILAENIISVLLPNEVSIQVPSPAALVTQKLIINHERLPLEKRDKDLFSVDYLLPYIEKSEREMQSLKNVYANLTKKQKAYFDEAAKNLTYDIRKAIP